ncbi:unnamed protein product, partial [Rotaria sordida]
PLRRIKYYQLPCQKRSPLLSCFYDDNHFCFCNDYDHQCLTDCFEFNHRTEHNCFGQSNCENGAHCLQDKTTCPQTSICVCPKCFYGARCQFTSNLFDLSLDAILGYYIQPHINIKHQPSIVQLSQRSDLSSREHLWTILDRRIRQHIPPPKSKPELKELLIEEWNQIGSDITEKLIDLVENRLQECLNQGRFSTRY